MAEEANTETATETTTTPETTAAPAEAPAATAAAPAKAEAKGEPKRGTDGKFASTDWRDGLEGEHLDFAKRLASPHDAVKSAYELRKANAAMIKPLGKDAKPEDVAKFKKALGAGEKVEDYKFTLAEGYEPTDLDKTLHSEVAQALYEANAPVALTAKLQGIVEKVKESVEAEQERLALKGRTDSETALRKEWGADYDGNVELARRAIKAFGSTALQDFMFSTHINGQKLSDHPEMVRMMGQIGRRMGEGQFIGIVDHAQRGTLAEERAQIMADNPPGTDKYKNPSVQRRLREINEQLYGTQPIVGQGGRTY